ncbi:MAG TPA: response regulator [Candidatus Paenibacillus intestinavium]|nr:response regulator [Candidatus Paenibacillus intestinavium]
MKILIVDDEKHVRATIQMLIDMESYGITEWLEAADGSDAIAIIKQQQPQIIITDMYMPKMNGVELLKWIHEHYPQGKTIIVSGHDDFDYVRHALKYGGSDYLLKPLDEDEINQAISKAINGWHKDQREQTINYTQRKAINQFMPIYWDKMFSNLVQGTVSYTMLAEQLETDFKLKSQPEQAQLAIISTALLPVHIKQKFTTNLDLLFYLLTNIVNEYLQEDHAGYAFQYWNNKQELIIVDWESREQCMDRLERINDGIFTTLGSKIDFGVSTMKAFPQGMKACYQEASAALKQRNLLVSHHHLHYYDEATAVPLVPLPVREFEAELHIAIQSAHLPYIQQAVHKWIQSIAIRSTLTMEQLELWQHEYMSFKNRYRSEISGSSHSEQMNIESMFSVLELPSDDEGKLSLLQFEKNIFNDLMKLVQQLSKLTQRESNVIYDIVKYIDTHYSEEITLQHISERFFLSREYISRRFKQETSENLSDYIERIRIDKVKVLLANPLLKIIQIAELVGYKDEKYLSKVFKKAVGMSPNVYRKQL